jgi:hypothetical protein
LRSTGRAGAALAAPFGQNGVWPDRFPSGLPCHSGAMQASGHPDDFPPAMMKAGADENGADKSGAGTQTGWRGTIAMRAALAQPAGHARARSLSRVAVRSDAATDHGGRRRPVFQQVHPHLAHRARSGGGRRCRGHGRVGGLGYARARNCWPARAVAALGPSR